MNGINLFDGALLFAVSLFVPAFAFWLFFGNKKVNGVMARRRLAAAMVLRPARMAAVAQAVAVVAAGTDPAPGAIKDTEAIGHDIGKRPQ